MADEVQSVVQSNRQKLDYETVLFTATIAIFGFAAESIIRANFGTRTIFVTNVPVLPLIVAVQLLSGMRLGAVRGIISSVTGGYFACAFANGNLGLISILSPIVAGGFVNALLPAILLKLRSEGPTRASASRNPEKPVVAFLSYFIAAFVVALSAAFLGRGNLIFLSGSLLLWYIGSASLMDGSAQRSARTQLIAAIIVTGFVSSIIGSAAAPAGIKLGAMIFCYALPWFFWVTIYSALLLQFSAILDTKTEGEADHIDHLKSKYAYVFFAVMLVAFAGFCLQSCSTSEVRLLSDSYDYLEIASHQPLSAAFWIPDSSAASDPNWWRPLLHAHSLKVDSSWAPPLTRPLPRPQLYPLFIWLFGDNVDLVIFGQTIVGESCWFFLAFAVFTAGRKSFGGLLAAILILVFRGLPGISGWDGIIQTESVSFSLLAGAYASVLLFAHSQKPRWILAATLFAFLYALIRDTNAYLVLFVGVSLTLYTAVAAKKGNAHNRKTRLYFVVSFIMILSFTASNFTSDLGKRWSFPLYQIMLGRVLNAPVEKRWFAAKGMPVSGVMMAHAGRVAGSDSSYFDDHEMRRFKQWESRDGKAVYIQWLISHPVQSMLYPLEDIPHALSSDLLAGQLARSYQPVLAQPHNYGGVEYAMVLLLAAMFTILHLTSADTKMKGLTLLVLASMLLALPHYLVAWNGDASALYRHTAQVLVQFQLAFVILLGLSIDTLARQVSKLLTRGRSVEHDRR